MKKLTPLQLKCLQSFVHLKVSEGLPTRIDYVGVTVILRGGHKAFYSLNSIMDPINRLILSNNRKAHA